MDGFVVSLREVVWGVGPYFGFAFLAIVLVWVQFVVRWRDEKRELALSAEGIETLLRELERPTGVLHKALRDRFHGRACDKFADREQFEEWFTSRASGHGSRNTGMLFQRYLWSVLSSVRARLRPFDNRVNLTGVRNELKRYRYHRWLNFGLANTAISMGILGTVTGLWAGFSQIDFSGGDIPGVMEEVMSALSQALYTTAVGVLVSMPIIISGLKMEQQLEELFGMAQEVHNALVATLQQIELEETVDDVG